MQKHDIHILFRMKPTNKRQWSEWTRECSHHTPADARANAWTKLEFAARAGLKLQVRIYFRMSAARAVELANKYPDSPFLEFNDYAEVD